MDLFALGLDGPTRMMLLPNAWPPRDPLLMTPGKDQLMLVMLERAAQVMPQTPGPADARDAGAAHAMHQTPGPADRDALDSGQDQLMLEPADARDALALGLDGPTRMMLLPYAWPPRDPLDGPRPGPADARDARAAHVMPQTPGPADARDALARDPIQCCLDSIIRLQR